MVFELVAVVVGIIVLVSQSRRISKLEEIIQGKVTPAATPATSAQPQPISVEAIASRANSIPTSAPVQASVAAPVSKATKEEASGRLLGKIGIAAVLIGVAFFLKYAFDSNWIGPAGRVMIGVVIGFGFVGVGQYLRKNYLKYSDLLIGGGIAILYLSVFAGYSFYDLFSSFTAGVFMFIVTALSFAISIVNATQTLALVGVIGGFATPFLVGSNENAMMQLFGYLTILNVGILAISFFKKWPRLNVAGFIGTAINFGSWFMYFYTQADLAPTLIFVFITFGIFLIASVARTIISGTSAQKIKAEQTDYLLLGANALWIALFGYIMLEPQYSGILGFAAVFLAVVYCVVAYIANKYNSEDVALNIFLPGLAVVFLSIAIPMQFDGAWIAVGWLVEAVALYGIASIINNRGFQVMGVIVYILGIISMLSWISEQYVTEKFVPIFNGSFALLVIATAVAYAIAYMYHRFGSRTVDIQKRGIMVFVVVAQILTLSALSTQITSYHSAQQIVLTKTYNVAMTQNERINTGYNTNGLRNEAYEKYHTETRSIRNQSNTLVSILWALYAAVLTAIGFIRRVAVIRRLGLILFVITGLKVLIDVWSLGQLYRIISFIAFGLITLIASFAYAKYKDRLKDSI
jgi:uncharacterized membrane protein